MVLKKPYAFLIKHFKLIHLLLSVPLIYLIIKTGAIASFFRSYVAANYYTNITNIPGTYINYFMYLAILVILLLVLAVYFLMKQKKKDTRFYLFLLIYYLLLFVILSVCYSILGAVESASVEAQTVRVYRDVSWILYIPQFFFTGYTLLRGIGFDLKKFNFEEDAKELEITDIDNEEFELVFGKDAYKYKRTFRRFIREFKYYVMENKVTFGILSAIIVVVFGTMFYLNFGVYHKSYRQTQRITHNNLVVRVTSSVLSNLDLGGNVIAPDKYYLAVGLQIKNNGTSSMELDYENFKAEVSGRLFTATLDRTSYFADLGIPYTRGMKIAPGEENTYVLTYDIEKELIDQDITLKILESLNMDVGSVTPIYKTVNLKYDKVFDNKEVRTVDFGKILEMSGSRVGMVQIQLKNSLVTNSYEYRYQSCSGSNCQNLRNKVVSGSKKTLLVLERMFSMDTYSSYYKARKGSGSFTSDFARVRYEIVGETKTSNISDVTPKELSDTWIFSVPEEMKHADKIELLIQLRGSIYVMKIK